MDVITGFFSTMAGAIATFANFVFGITILGVNMGALFVIGAVVGLIAWLIWG